MAREETITKRPPLPRRPKYGWQAWEAIVGYVALRHSPDAVLKIEIYPMSGIVGWGASFSWGQYTETAQDMISFGTALTQLWHRVEHNYSGMFDAAEISDKHPVNYDDDSWLDEPTFEIFSRLVGVSEVAFRGDWRLMVVYQPVEIPDNRVQARLVATGNTISLGGKGPTLRDAGRSLFMAAAARYRQFLVKPD
jgi:hypothetical protein